GCGACHCADAMGGCALDAPALVGVDLDTLTAMVVGEGAHPGGKFNLSDDDVADLQAYLASLE
ncbi:MAG: c-type cytochrome, partial [Phycisphaerae bacterium]